MPALAQPRPPHSHQGSALHPVRATERAKILSLLDQGRSVMLVGYPGDGLTWIADQLSDDLGGPELQLRATSSVSLDDVEGFLDATAKSRGAVIYGPGRLPQESIELLGNAIFRQPRPLVFVVGAVYLETTQHPLPPVLSFLMDQWGRDDLARLDLFDMDVPSLTRMISDAAPAGLLGDLQMRTLAVAAAGLPFVALDLLQLDEGTLKTTPLRVPAPSDVGLQLPRHTVQRMASWYTSLDRDQAEILHHLWRISPVPESTAFLLYGEQPVRALMSRRVVQRVIYKGHPSLRVPFLHGACAQQVLNVDIDAVERRFRSRLVALHRCDFPMGDGATIAAARYRFLGEHHYNVLDDALWLDTTKLYVERGQGTEARALAVTLRSSTASATMRFLCGVELVRAHNLLGEHEVAEKLGLDLLTGMLAHDSTRPAEDLLSLISATTVAQQWRDSTTKWWDDPTLVSGLEFRLPGVPVVCRGLCAATATTTDAAHLSALRELAGSDSHHDAIRALAAALLIHHLLAGHDGIGLHRAIRLAEEIREKQSEAALSGPHGSPERWWFVVLRAALLQASLLTGLPLSGTTDALVEVEVFIEESMGVTTAPSWLCTYLAAGLAATARTVRGETALAAKNRESVHTAFRPAAPPMMRDFFVCCAPLPETPTGHALTDITSAHLGLASGLSPSPDTVASLEATLGELDAQDFPLLRSRMDHLVGLRDDDADLLMQAGADLLRMHALKPARLALERSRALFQARSASSKVAAIDQWLAEAPKGADQPPEEHPKGASVSFTERESEVARLIVQGLTNAQIASRLYLSVRTIESHVMQLRIKLGAPRRRDIPRKLQEHGLA